MRERRAQLEHPAYAAPELLAQAPNEVYSWDITKQRTGIVAAIEHGLSNARVEAINTQIRMITRRAFGFHSPDALIALAMLSLGALCPPLPR